MNNIITENIQDAWEMAKFMGFKNTLGSKKFEYCRWYHPDNFGLMFFPEEIEYKTSWTWLMPVVKKCTEVGYGSVHSEFDGMWDECFEDSHTHFLNNDVENVYQSVLKFVKWYNKQES